jgi:hypothetical protein
MVHAIMLGIAISIDAAAGRTACPASLPVGFSLGAQQRFVNELEERPSGRSVEFLPTYDAAAPIAASLP